MAYYSPTVDQFKKILAEKNNVKAELIKILDHNNKVLTDQDKLDPIEMFVILPENQDGAWKPSGEDIDKLLSAVIMKDVLKK